MNWLITGGCGFLGTSLIKHLRREGGHGLRVVDDLSAGSREDLSGVCEFEESGTTQIREFPDHGVQFIRGDILDADLALEAAHGADVLVHLAANTGVGPSIANPRADCMANVFGTLNYLEAARHANVKRFIFASSGAPVGETEPPIHEEKAPHPASPYGASKLAGEGYCSAYYRTFGVETVALRFGNVYGPGSGHKTSVVAKFIKRAMDGETLEIYGDGTQTRDFIYVDDLIEALTLAATVEGVGGETFQIATSSETTVGELVEKLLPALEAEGISPVEVKNTAPPFKEVMRNFSDTTKAHQSLGWQTGVDLNDGLRRTVSWFVRSHLDGA